jgi:predicted RNase H-like HicB family nuclease
MRYPIVIEPGDETTAYGVVVPDLPGCNSAGDTLDEALDAAREAVAAWVDVALDSGLPIPPPSSLEAIRARPDYQGWSYGVVDVEDALFDDSIERVNITLPRRVLQRLDALAREKHMTRGAFIANLTLKAS